MKTNLNQQLPRLHGNRKVRCIISGRRVRVGEVRKAAKESAQRLIKAFQSPDWQTEK